VRVRRVEGDGPHKIVEGELLAAGGCVRRNLHLERPQTMLLHQRRHRRRQLRTPGGALVLSGALTVRPWRVVMGTFVYAQE
jgi:hypothetical protein